MDTGYIRCRCAECGKLLRVLVRFPDPCGPFEDTPYTCEYCNTELIITDPHEFNEDGTIKEV